MTSPEYLTGFASVLARRAIAMFRIRRARNSSTRPGCSFALTPLVTKYQTPMAPATAAIPRSSRNALSTGLMRASPLRLLREFRGALQEYLPRLLRAEIVGVPLIRRLRRGGGVGDDAVDRVHRLSGLRLAPHLHLRVIHRRGGRGRTWRLLRACHRVSGVRIGRRRGCRTWRQLCPDVPESALEMIDGRPHLRRVVGLSRRFQAAHRSGDDVVDHRLNPRALRRLGRGLWGARVLYVVLRRGHPRRERGGQQDRQPKAVRVHRSPPRPLPGVSMAVSDDTGASSPSPARNP